MADDILLTARQRLAQALLGQPDAAAPAFQWGAGGARLTPDEIAAQRKDAAALVAQGTSAEPFPTGTRGAGVWTQGMARVAKALLGGLEARDASNAAAANDAKDRDLLLANPALQSAAPAAAPAAVTADASAPRGIRNNNPLNIEDGPFAKSQPGYVGSDGRFAQFQTPDHGVAAANALLDSYGKRGLNSVSGIVGRWAPTSDGNNVSAYASDVANRLGIDPNAPLTPQQRPALIAAMGQHENGRPIQMPQAAAPAPSAPVVASGDDEAPAAPAAGSGIARVAAALGGPPQVAPQIAAPAPVAAPATPQVPPAQAGYIKQLLANAGTRAYGAALLN